MKKLIGLGLAALLLLPAAAYAASVGGAETVGQGEFSIGLDQEFVFDRDMKFYKTSFPITPGKRLMEIDKIYRSMLKASYGVFDNLDIYVKLGVADFKATRKWYSLMDPTWEQAREKCKGKNAFAYGVGFKGTYIMEDGWLIGMDIQYLRHKNNYTESFVIIGDAYTGSGKATFQEWHFAPYIAKRIGDFLPYLGGKYSDLRVRSKNNVSWGEEPPVWSARTKDKADNNFGVFAGIDYSLGERWKLNIEGRFLDETAVSAGATYRF